MKCMSCETLPAVLRFIGMRRKSFTSFPAFLNNLSKYCFHTTELERKTLIRVSVTVPEFLSALPLLSLIQLLCRCCLPDHHLSPTEPGALKPQRLPLALPCFPSDTSIQILSRYTHHIKCIVSERWAWVSCSVQIQRHTSCLSAPSSRAEDVHAGL